jgi:hypothetical protein
MIEESRMTPHRLTAALAALLLLCVPLPGLAQDPPSISLEMTLTRDTNGVPGDECGVSDALLVASGTEIEVCYAVTNTGPITFNLHDLEDSEFGTLLSEFGVELLPGATVWLSQNVTASSDTTFEGTWTAYNDGPSDVAEASGAAVLEVVAAAVPTLGWWARLLMFLLLIAFSGVYLVGKKVRVREE